MSTYKMSFIVSFLASACALSSAAHADTNSLSCDTLRIVFSQDYATRRSELEKRAAYYRNLYRKTTEPLLAISKSLNQLDRAALDLSKSSSDSESNLESRFKNRLSQYETSVRCKKGYDKDHDSVTATYTYCNHRIREGDDALYIPAQRVLKLYGSELFSRYNPKESPYFLEPHHYYKMPDRPEVKWTSYAADVLPLLSIDLSKAGSAVSPTESEYLETILEDATFFSVSRADYLDDRASEISRPDCFSSKRKKREAEEEAKTAAQNAGAAAQSTTNTANKSLEAEDAHKRSDTVSPYKSGGAR